MTLVEVVLAVGIVVTMMGSVYGFYSGALAARERITAAAERISAVRTVMGRITDELRSAMVFTAPRIEDEQAELDAAEAASGETAPPAGAVDVADVAAGKAKGTDVIRILSRLTTLGVEGTTDQVEFVTVGLPGPAAWADVEATETDTVIPAATDVDLIGYGLRMEEDEGGNTIGVIGLERWRKKEIIPSSLVEDEEENTERVLVSTHIKFIRFRYWQGDATAADAEGGTAQMEPWADGWGGGDMPKAIEVTLGFQPLPEDCDVEDYPYATFRRLIYIPGAGKRMMSTAGRGMGRGLEGRTSR